MSTSRTSFIETWLEESPSGLGSFETFDGLQYTIEDMKKAGIDVIRVSDKLFKIEGNTILLYWYQDNNQTITLGVELKKRPEGIVVSLLGKNPKYKGKPPYASDLYSDVLKDTNNNIRILSDKQLSDEGYNLWKRMVQKGHKVSVYDSKDPGRTFKTFTTDEEMEQYFKHDDTTFMRYQFVLSENVLSYCELKASFNLRRMRELSGLKLED